MFNVHQAGQQPGNGKIDGLEFGGQYFFGDTGFGVLANYTIVDGDVGFDDDAPPDVNQFALLGSERHGQRGADVREVRSLGSSRLQLARPVPGVGEPGWLADNPIYVEAYDQIDLSVGYDINDNLAVSFEAINLTGEDVRWHGRSEKQLWRLEDQWCSLRAGSSLQVLI